MAAYSGMTYGASNVSYEAPRSTNVSSSSSGGGAGIGGMIAGGLGLAFEGYGRAEQTIAFAKQTQTNIYLERLYTMARMRDHRRQTADLMGRQRAGAAASGVRVEEGSPMELLTQTLEDALLEQRLIELGSETKIEGMRENYKDHEKQQHLGQAGSTANYIGSIFGA